MANFCRAHADRIGHLHLVDTRRNDEHLPVGMGRIDSATVFAGLAGTVSASQRVGLSTRHRMLGRNSEIGRRSIIRTRAKASASTPSV